MNRRYRKTVIAGNWKMNMTATETKKFAEDLKKIMPRAKWCDTLICVPACNISTAMKAFKDLRISVGAENVYFEEKGAYIREKVLGFHSPAVKNVRGMGLMLGIIVDPEKRAGYVAKLMEQGVLVLTAGTDAIRLLPPLVITYEEIDQALEAMKGVFES